MIDFRIAKLLRTWLYNKQVQDVDVVYFSFGNMDEFRDAAAQIQQGMKFDGSLVFPKPRPWKERETQVYGCGIEGIDCLLQLNPKVFVAIERSGDTNQYPGEVGVDTPISVFVGMGQGTSGDFASNTHVIKM